MEGVYSERLRAYHAKFKNKLCTHSIKAHMYVPLKGGFHGTHDPPLGSPLRVLYLDDGTVGGMEE